jgi:hypothetical protein
MEISNTIFLSNVRGIAMKNDRQMNEWSFPLGQFIPNEQSTSEDRTRSMDEMARMPEMLRSCVANLSNEQLQTPYRPQGWNIRQVIHHIADNNMNAYIRFKRALTEDIPTAGSYHENLWAELKDVQDTPVENSLKLVEVLHHRFVVLLQTLSPEQYQRTFISPTHGEMSLDIATQRFAWHVKHHIAQINSLKERMNWL